jgi:hypothetical protein
MPFNINTNARNALLDGLLSKFNGQSFEIRDGAMPASADDPPTGNVLASFVMGNPAFGAAANGRSVISSQIQDTAADATGTAGWARLFASSGERMDWPVMQNKSISGASQANPCQITCVGHGFTTGDNILITGVVGMVEINDMIHTITVTGVDTFTLDGVDSTAYGVYVSGGKAVLAGYLGMDNLSIQLGGQVTIPKIVLEHPA